MEPLFTGLSPKKADLILLILASQNIETLCEREKGGQFSIQVRKPDREQALEMVAAYEKENRFHRLKRQVQDIPLSSFKSYPAFTIMALLSLIHLFCLQNGRQEQMILEYGASALYILQGETYRAVTALFLHADARHLVGNLAGLLVFGAPFISLSGYGTGPFMLLFCGTIGNLINAHAYQTAHLSIGASTSVMAAAGLLSAYQIVRKGRPASWQNLMPLFAGALLMGMLSQGENTDVWAHVFGFFSGFITGLPFFPLNRTLAFPQKECLALAVTVLILVSALLSAA